MSVGSDVASRRQLLAGGLQVVAADALALPTGIIVAAVLARTIGPEGYGVVALAVSTVTAVEWLLTALTSRASVALVSETDGWREIGSGLLRIHLAIGAAGGLLFGVFAFPLARLFDEPRVGVALLILAPEIPVVALAAGCRSLLAGQRRFGPRALAGVARWVTRLVAVVAFVMAGWAVPGAVAGNLAGALAGLVAARAFVGPLPSSDVGAVWSRFRALAVPTFALAIGLRLLDRFGLVALKLLGGTIEDVARYAAAQNFALAPGLVAISFTPLLLASTTRALAAGDTATARAMGRDALRVGVLAWPLAALIAGSAPEIVGIVYGPAFSGAAALALPFVVAAFAAAFTSVAGALLTALGRASLATRMIWPALSVALLGFVLLVPRFGGVAAAWVTCAASVVGAVSSLRALYVVWAVALPVGSCARSAVVSVLVWLAAAAWPMPGLWWGLKAVVLMAGALAAFAALGELTPGVVSVLVRTRQPDVPPARGPA